MPLIPPFFIIFVINSKISKIADEGVLKLGKKYLKYTSQQEQDNISNIFLHVTLQIKEYKDN